MEITPLNLMLVVVALMVGVYIIVEVRIHQVMKTNNATISSFLTVRDAAIKKTIISISDRMVDDMFERYEELDAKLNSIIEGEVNGRED